jgi:hypothetical protein
MISNFDVLFTSQQLSIGYQKSGKKNRPVIIWISEKKSTNDLKKLNYIDIILFLDALHITIQINLYRVNITKFFLIR